jgi:hypothetical protein
MTRRPADPADWPPLRTNRCGHRSIYWRPQRGRYAIEVRHQGSRYVRYAKRLAVAIDIARELRREVFGFTPAEVAR